MAQMTDTSIKINAPINEVYSFISNMENMVYFWDKIKSVEKDPENVEAVGPGSKYYIIFKTVLGGKKKIEVELTNSVAHEKFEYRDNSNSLHVLTGYNFSEEQDGTLVKIYRKTELGPIANLLSFNAVSSRDSKKELGKVLNNLKRFLEAEPVSGEDQS